MSMNGIERNYVKPMLSESEKKILASRLNSEVAMRILLAKVQAPHKCMRDIAADLGISKSYVHKRLTQCCEVLPEMKRVIRMTIPKPYKKRVAKVITNANGANALPP